MFFESIDDIAKIVLYTSTIFLFIKASIKDKKEAFFLKLNFFIHFAFFIFLIFISISLYRTLNYSIYDIVSFKSLPLSSVYFLLLSILFYLSWYLITKTISVFKKF